MVCDRDVGNSFARLIFGGEMLSYSLQANICICNIVYQFWPLGKVFSDLSGLRGSKEKLTLLYILYTPATTWHKLFSLKIAHGWLCIEVSANNNEKVMSANFVFD